MAIGAFQRAHEGALLGPALPFAVLDLVGVFLGRLVVPKSGRLVFQHAGHVVILESLGSPFTGFRPDAQCRIGVRSAGIYRVRTTGYDPRADRSGSRKFGMNLLVTRLAAAALLGVVFVSPHNAAVRAQGVADFYRGKTIDLDI